MRILCQRVLSYSHSIFRSGQLLAVPAVFTLATVLLMAGCGKDAGTDEAGASTDSDPKQRLLDYHANSPNGSFEIKAATILGVGQLMEDESRYVFPYVVLTDKNPFGFIVLLRETSDGFKFDWDEFARGQDVPIHEFAKNGSGEAEFLVALERTHSFDDRLSEEDEKNLVALAIGVPAAPPGDEKPIAYVEIGSEIADKLEAVLKWGQFHFCRVKLAHTPISGAEGAILRVLSYERLAMPDDKDRMEVAKKKSADAGLVFEKFQKATSAEERLEVVLRKPIR